jgi:hypothetical protein
MKALNLQSSSIEDLAFQLEHLDINIKPNLAIVFASSNFPFEQLPKLFSSKNIRLVGCTSLSEIFDKNIFEKSVSVLLLEIDQATNQYFEENHNGTDAFESGKTLATKALEVYKNPAILVFASGINLDGNSLINGIHHISNGEIPIFGALASDDFQFIATYTIGNNGTSNNGIQALIFDSDKVNVKGASFSGWTEIGATHIITKSEKNIVYEINNKPALDEFQKYFDIRTNIKGTKNESIDLLAQFPFKIFREEGRAIIRSIMHSNEKDKSLVLAGAVNQGDKFRFCSAPDLDVIESTVNSFNDFKQNTPDIDCSIMISCGARLAVFGPLLENEIKGIYELWNKPMIGFFSSGEIGPSQVSKSICEFQNVTCTLLTLSEIE